MRKFLCLAALTAALSITAPASANLITNPGFETGDLTGWTQSGETSFTDVVAFPHSGSFGLRAGPEPGVGFLSQTLATVAGESYSFSFWLGNGGGQPSFFSASFDGFPIFVMAGLPAFPYTEFTAITAPASTASTLLEFSFFHDPNYWFLDDVIVEVADGAAIPEPATLLLFGTGLAGLAALRRRRKAKA